MPLDFKDFASISLSTYNLDDLNIDDKKAIKALSSDIQKQVITFNKRAVKEIRCKKFKIKNTLPYHYSEKIFQLDKKKRLICGIRHLNLNPEEPFLQILTNFKTSKKELLKIYKNTLQKHFAVFNPKFIQIHHHRPIKENINASCFYVQHASVIQKLPNLSKSNKIELINPSNDDYYKWYVKGYKKFHKENPKLATKVPMNEKDLMESSRKEGLLKLARYNGQIIGLIAANRDSFLGMPGIYFLEIFIDEKFKGKGLGKSLQRTFIKDCCSKNEIVWGTIDFANKPSVKTALANKRKLIRAEQLIQIK